MALLLETPACTAILGADLEEEPGQGWTRIANHSIAYRKAGKALVIKVAHHGSPNAHCEAIWAALANPPIAMLTTFNKGNTRRPAPDDVARILAQTEAAFSCSSFTRMAASRDHDVDKLLGLLNIKRERRFPPTGHIRLKVKPGCEPTVELFGEATHLSLVHKAG